MIRYEVDIRPKDGSGWISLYVDCDVLVVPRRDDNVELVDSVSTSVIVVSFAPTQDPCVYVRCRGITVENAVQAKRLAEDARNKEGWIIRN